MAFQQVEYEFPDPDKEDKDSLEIELEPTSAEPMQKPGKAKKEDKEDKIVAGEYEIEIEDDTPPEDRGRKPSEPPEDVTEEELQDYSEKVRRRIQHFSKGYHDERRAKEQAMRERQELERFAQKLVEENNKLKESTNKSQTALLEQAKKNAKVEFDAAKIKYKRAYEAGDADGVLAAQEELTTAKIKLDRISNFKLPPLQEKEVPVETPREEQVSDAPAPQVDAKAQEWQKANPWFGTDDEMTSFALGLHNKLVKSGVDPQSDDYYETINSRMRKVFPENFDEVAEEEKPKRRANVVAPATRSTAPKKVKLSPTQMAIAKRLGVPLELYAKQVAEEMRKANG